jgi:hypothetical protein
MQTALHHLKGFGEVLELSEIPKYQNQKSKINGKFRVATNIVSTFFFVFNKSYRAAEKVQNDFKHTTAVSTRNATS